MERVAILGAGTMGQGIAQVCAMAGYVTTLTDTRDDALERAREGIGATLAAGVAKGKVAPEVAALARASLRTVTGLEAAVEGADLVIEAVPEDAALKARLLAAAEARVGPAAVLATNTSSLSIDGLAASLARPERFIGAHFFNPVHVMTLLEVVRGTATTEHCVATVRSFADRIGKEVIVVRDAPGFATSRLGVCLGMEAIRMVEQGVASPEDIDKAMVLGYRHPVGPLRLTDLVGLDVRMAIGSHLAVALGNAAFEPPALLRRMVAEGRLGKKSGEGFYRWEG